MPEWLARGEILPCGARLRLELGDAAREPAEHHAGRPGRARRGSPPAPLEQAADQPLGDRDVVEVAERVLQLFQRGEVAAGALLLIQESKNSVA